EPWPSIGGGYLSGKPNGWNRSSHLDGLRQRRRASALSCELEGVRGRRHRWRQGENRAHTGTADVRKQEIAVLIERHCAGQHLCIQRQSAVASTVCQPITGKTKDPAIRYDFVDYGHVGYEEKSGVVGQYSPRLQQRGR